MAIALKNILAPILLILFLLIGYYILRMFLGFGSAGAGALRGLSRRTKFWARRDKKLINRELKSSVKIPKLFGNLKNKAKKVNDLLKTPDPEGKKNPNEIWQQGIKPPIADIEKRIKTLSNIKGDLSKESTLGNKIRKAIKNNVRESYKQRDLLIAFTNEIQKQKGDTTKLKIANSQLRSLQYQLIKLSKIENAITLEVGTSNTRINTLLSSSLSHLAQSKRTIPRQVSQNAELKVAEAERILISVKPLEIEIARLTERKSLLVRKQTLLSKQVDSKRREISSLVEKTIRLEKAAKIVTQDKAYRNKKTREFLKKRNKKRKAHEEMLSKIKLSEKDKELVAKLERAAQERREIYRQEEAFYRAQARKKKRSA